MTHFYDDYKMLDSTLGECTAQHSLREVCKLGGVVLDVEKAQDMKAKVKFMGCIFDYAEVFDQGRFLFDCLPERRKQLLKEVDV